MQYSGQTPPHYAYACGPQLPWCSNGHAVQSTSSAAILSLLSGLLAIPLSCVFFLSFPAALLAITSGLAARRNIRRSGGRLTGRGIATCGVISGMLSGVLTTLILVAAVVISVEESHSHRRHGDFARIEVHSARPHSAEQIDKDNRTRFESIWAATVESDDPVRFSGNTESAEQTARHVRETLLLTHQAFSSPDILTEAGRPTIDTTPEQPEDNSATKEQPVQAGTEPACHVFCEMRHGEIFYVICLPETTPEELQELKESVWYLCREASLETYEDRDGLAVILTNGIDEPAVLSGRLESSSDLRAGLRRDHSGLSRARRIF